MMMKRSPNPALIRIFRLRFRHAAGVQFDDQVDTIIEDFLSFKAIQFKLL
jgi:hypothetical protein